jgi:predicted ATPase
MTSRTQDLHSVTIAGFKSISSLIGLELKPVNVLIGANGSGKSNFIGAFSFLHAIREGRLQDYIRKGGGADQLLYFGSKNTSEIHFHVSFSNEINQYDIRLRPSADDSLYVESETCYFWDKRQYQRPMDTYLSPREGGKEAGISDSSLTRTSSWVRHRLGGWRVYHVHDTSASSPMRKTAKVNDNAFLRADGSNLPAFLYLLRAKHPTSYRMIRNALRQVAPFFDDFLLEPDQLNTDVIRLAWKHRESDQYFGASSLSDGSLRFLALATLLLQPASLKPSTILVDEPELGLHPYAINVLGSLVRQAATEAQVILSTQSPQLLDQFAPEDVLVAERGEDGTQISRIDPEPLKVWLQDYSLGQLWEKNEIGGRPSRA